ncbi:MAG: DUF2793 domain-containing protein [Planktomarina sp.]
MSATSSNLSLPYIQANQAQKHITHNEAIRILDSLTQLSVISATLAVPPTIPVRGDRYIVGADPTGDWEGQSLHLAVWDENAWRFFAPHAGWTAWDQATGTQLTFANGAWASTAPAPDFNNLDGVGVGTSADATNRLAVKSDATLLTNAGAGHQVKVNKAADTDTASLLFQTNWAGRAEMGTAGSDDFAIKVSADGATWHAAMVVDADTGEVTFPNTEIGGSAFGNSPLLTVDYMTSKGSDLVTNGTGLLQNNYNMPAAFTFDPIETPNTAGSFLFKGYYSGLHTNDEFIGVNPNQTYRLGTYIKQEARIGDWSAYAYGDSQSQYLGIVAFDIDKNVISAPHHMRYKTGGVDSLTTLTAPLSPGDTILNLENAAGWNDTTTAGYRGGVTVFGYRNSFGRQYSHYSRHYAFDLFESSGVDKANHTITLKTGFPQDMGNPDDPNGTWPAGTAVANCNSGNTYKYALLQGTSLPTSGDWYAAVNHIGGIDLSGTNVATNFPPGTAYVKLLWLPNYTNRNGGYSIFPDTGPDHKVWFSGLSVTPENTAHQERAANGSVILKVITADPTNNTLSLAPPALQLTRV